MSSAYCGKNKKLWGLAGLAVVLLVMSGCADLIKKLDSTIRMVGERSTAVQRYHYRGGSDALYAEALSVSPKVVAKGGSITQSYRFAVLAPSVSKRFHIQEVVTLSGGGVSVELSRKSFEKPQAIHTSTLEFTIPKDLPGGSYELITVISTSGLSKKLTGKFSVR